MENIINFCKRNNIKFLPIKIEIDVENKEKIYLDCKKHGDKSKWEDGMCNFKITDFKKYSLEQCIYFYETYQNETKYIGIDATDIQQLDIDDLTGKYKDSKLSEEFCNLPYYLSLTKKQPHYFIKTKYHNKKIDNNMILDDGSVCDHDVLYKGCWGWCRTDAMIYNGNNNMEYNKWDNITPPKSPIEKDTKREKVIEKENEPSNITEENIEIAELMNVKKYLLNYNEWTTTIWALKNAGFSYDFANKLSQKVNDIDDTKYDENALEELWDKGKEGVGLGTIYRQAKESNKKEYYKIKIKYLPKQIYKSEDYSLAKILVDECFNDRLVYCDGSLMTYTNNKWYVDNDFDYLKYMISNDGVKYFSEIEKLLLNYSMCLNQDDDDFETIRKNKNIINDIISLLGKLTWKNNISKEIKSIVINKHQKIEFNNNGYDFAFDNTKYNFKTEKFEDIKRTDYISYSAGYDYKEPEPDNIKLIEKLIEEIFPNEDIRKCYMSIMRTAFMGYTKDKFIVANGNGGNGKGLLNELLLECVGDDYGYTGNIGALTDKKKTGSNPEIANLNKKRFCIFKEPNQKEKILLGNVKELVDNKEINARQNYSNNTKVRLQATFILECNKKLAFDGEVNESEYRRFIDVLFESTFTTNKKLLNDTNLSNVYEANADYKQDEFKQNYRCALFKYIIDNAEKQIIVPECVVERTKEYIDSNDELLEFMKDNYIYEPEKNDPKILQVKDVFNLYKNSEYYERLYKKERPTYKTFCNSIKEHASYKHFYHKRKKIKDVDYYSILIGHKIIPEEEKKEGEKKKEEED